MHIESLGVTKVVRPPNAVDDLAAGEHSVSVFEKKLEKLKLFQRHRDLVAVYENQVLVDIHANRARLENPVFHGFWLSVATKHGLHSGKQFTAGIGLGHVVISADFEPNHLVNFGVFGSEHDYRNVRGLANLAAHFVAAEPWKH